MECEKIVITVADKEKFEEIFMNYFPKVKAFIRKILKSEAEAEDMAQDIFLKLWLNPELMNEIQIIDAYLYRMARNQIYNYIEHKNIGYKFVESQDKEEASRDDIHEAIYANETNLLIKLAVDKMPPQRKAIFILSREEHLSNNDIAIKLNISKRTVDGHLSMALADIRKIIYLMLFFITD